MAVQRFGCRERRRRVALRCAEAAQIQRDCRVPAPRKRQLAYLDETSAALAVFHIRRVLQDRRNAAGVFRQIDIGCQPSSVAHGDHHVAQDVEGIRWLGRLAVADVHPRDIAATSDHHIGFDTTPFRSARYATMGIRKEHSALSGAHRQQSGTDCIRCAATGYPGGAAKDRSHAATGLHDMPRKPS